MDHYSVIDIDFQTGIMLVVREDSLSEDPALRDEDGRIIPASLDYVLDSLVPILELHIQLQELHQFIDIRAVEISFLDIQIESGESNAYEAIHSRQQLQQRNEALQDQVEVMNDVLDTLITAGFLLDQRLLPETIARAARGYL